MLVTKKGVYARDTNSLDNTVITNTPWTLNRYQGSFLLTLIRCEGLDI